MNETIITPMIYSIADALEIDMKLDFTEVKTGKLRGNRHVIMEVFEGYSPTVVTEVIDTIIDQPAGIIAVCVRIWGNLCIMCVNDTRTQTLTVYVYDKSKVTEDSTPWDKNWSRRQAYNFLSPGIKGVYFRSIFETKWSKLNKGPSKLRLYNDMRWKGTDAKTSYMAMWGDMI